MVKPIPSTAPDAEPWGEDAGSLVPLGDAAQVRAMLIASARARHPISYSELLMAMGHRFTRPRMRAVCRTLDAIDEAARACGEPELAVLVVRESDGLPGQGWWASGAPGRVGYAGAWTGSQAAAFVGARQALAFDYWTDPSRAAQM